MTQDNPLENEQRQLAAACKDLVREFGEKLPESEVTSRFEHVLAAYDDAPIRSFIPVLAAREARSQLRSLSDA